MWGIFESERGRILATKLVKGLSVLFRHKDKVSIGARSEVAGETFPLGHYRARDGSAEPLLFSGESSSEISPNGSASGSPGQGDNTLHPVHDPSPLTASSPILEISTLDSRPDLLLADSRPSLESMSSTMVGFNVVPPSPEESRAPSLNQLPVDLFHFMG